MGFVISCQRFRETCCVHFKVFLDCNLHCQRCENKQHIHCIVHKTFIGRSWEQSCWTVVLVMIYAMRIPTGPSEETATFRHKMSVPAFYNQSLLLTNLRKVRSWCICSCFVWNTCYTLHGPFRLRGHIVPHTPWRESWREREVGSVMSLSQRAVTWNLAASALCCYSVSTAQVTRRAVNPIRSIKPPVSLVRKPFQDTMIQMQYSVT